MQNVCYFNTINFWGGGEKLHFEYALEFKKKGYNVWLVCKKNAPLREKAIAHNIPVFAMNAGSLSFLNPIKLLQLILFYRRFNIDTVIFSTSQDAKLASFSGWLGKVANRVYLRGLATTIKSSLVNKLMFKAWLTHVVVNSDATKNKVFQNLLRSVAPSMIGKIYHGIEVPEFNHDGYKMPIIAEKAKGIVLGNAGRLTLQKGQQHLIEVAKQLKEKNVEFTMFIAGTGELHNELLKKIKEYQLENHVFLLGFISDMDDFMRSIDIFLLSSEWEGFGYVIVEALAQKKPVVAFDISSNPEIITQNTTGFLVPFPNIKKFTEKTLELITNTDLREAMGSNGRQSVIDRFNITDRITEFEVFIIEQGK